MGNQPSTFPSLEEAASFFDIYGFASSKDKTSVIFFNPTPALSVLARENYKIRANWFLYEVHRNSERAPELLSLACIRSQGSPAQQLFQTRVLSCSSHTTPPGLETAADTFVLIPQENET